MRLQIFRMLVHLNDEHQDVMYVCRCFNFIYCMYVCMYVCFNVFTVYMYVCMLIVGNVSMYVCMNACMYVMYVHKYVCMYVCTYATSR